MKIWSVSHIFAKLDKIADISRSRPKNCKLTPMQGGYRNEYRDRRGMCPQAAGLHVGYTAPGSGAVPWLSPESGQRMLPQLAPKFFVWLSPRLRKRLYACSRWVVENSRVPRSDTLNNEAFATTAVSRAACLRSRLGQQRPEATPMLLLHSLECPLSK